MFLMYPSNLGFPNQVWGGFGMDRYYLALLSFMWEKVFHHNFCILNKPEVPLNYLIGTSLYYKLGRWKKTFNGIRSN